MNQFFLLAIPLLLVTTGCGSTSQPAAATSSVEATPVSEAMVGTWGIEGEPSLIIRKEGDRVVIGVPENDAWRMDIHDARIVDESIHFVQKNYLHSGEPHPFSGVACNCIIALEGDGENLSFGMTTVHSPEFEADVLTRID